MRESAENGRKICFFPSVGVQGPYCPLVHRRYDPFGKDYMMYRFQNRCLEFPDLDYPDRLMYIYFNTSGTTPSYWEGESTAVSADALA